MRQPGQIQRREGEFTQRVQRWMQLQQLWMLGIWLAFSRLGNVEWAGAGGEKQAAPG